MSSQPVQGGIENLDRALREYLRSYRPIEEGLNGISTCVIDLPVPDWSVFSWWETVTVNLTAAQATVGTIFTVPTDERAYIKFIRGARVTGDNNFLTLRVTVPATYSGGGVTYNLITLAAATTDLYWPDIAGRQTVDYIVDAVPLLLEPGTVIETLPDGSGAGASTFTVVFNLMRTKLIRILAPYPA